METLAEALEQSHAAADAAEREHEKLCDFLRSEVEQRDRDAVRAASEAERVRRIISSDVARSIRHDDMLAVSLQKGATRCL